MAMTSSSRHAKSLLGILIDYAVHVLTGTTNTLANFCESQSLVAQTDDTKFTNHFCRFNNPALCATV